MFHRSLAFVSAWLFKKISLYTFRGALGAGAARPLGLPPRDHPARAPGLIVFEEISGVLPSDAHQMAR